MKGCPWKKKNCQPIDFVIKTKTVFNTNQNTNHNTQLYLQNVIIDCIYEEGESEHSNIVCSTPITGIAPTNLFSLGTNGGIELQWTEGSELVLEYKIYKNNEFLASTTDLNFFDEGAVIV